MVVVSLPTEIPADIAALFDQLAESDTDGVFATIRDGYRRGIFTEDDMRAILS